MQQSDRENAIEIAFLFLTIVILMVRVFVPASVLNLLVNYTEEGGFFLVKFHLAAYAILAMLLLTLCTRPFVLMGADINLFRTLLRTAAMLTMVTAIAVIVSGFGATGFLIDTYLVATLAGLLLLTQRHHSRLIAAEAIIVFGVLSAVIGIGEMLMQQRLLPFDEGEPVFRPIGLAGHPLALGAHIVLTIGFVTLCRWPLWSRIAVTLLLFIGLAASGARLAMIAGAAEILLLLILSRWHGLSAQHEKLAKMMATLFVLVLGGGLLATLFFGGFLDRFNNTLVDDNFMARVRIYEVFRYVSWQDIFLGMDASDLHATTKANLDLNFIESAPVYIILTLGLPIALAFTVVVVSFFTRLLAGAPVQARIAAAVFVLVDLSNNGLATKNPDIILLTVLLVASRSLPAPISSKPRRSPQPRQPVLSTTSSSPARLSV
ncbi:VpsF family polysaccharide biosynthesis protein [Pseudorhizobium pelagicum]|nr:VpsF family polysaccharide biosynthesis protein [Pseudorhizobium pelagicum]